MPSAGNILKIADLDLFAMRAPLIVAVARSLCIRRSQMYRKNAFFVGILAAGCLVAASVVAPSIGHAQVDPRVTKSIETMKSMTAKLGAPKLEVNEVVDEAPAFVFRLN